MEALGKDGRYELRGEIGQGTSGVVVAAMDLHRRVPVVLRRFDKALPADAIATYAKLALAIDDADIAGAVTPYAVAISEPAPFAVFAALDGGSLESLLKAGALQWTRAVEIVSSCAATLDAVAAATGEVHGHLKPSNVWISQEGKTLVLDLGTAAICRPGPVRRDGEIVEYRAPEQLDGAPVDARADVFALAVLLVELTTGMHPFTGATAFQAAHKLTRTPPDLTMVTRGMAAGGAREVAKLLTRALASAPDERHSDARTFAAALAYVGKIVGAPTPWRTPRSPSVPSPQPPAPSQDDSTTILRLPGASDLLIKAMLSPGLPKGPVESAARHDPALPAVRVESGLPGGPGVPGVPVMPAAHAVHAVPVMPAPVARVPAPSRPVLADGTERISTIAASRYDAQRARSAAADEALTQVLSEGARGAGQVDAESSARTIAVERTERDMHYRGDREPPRTASNFVPNDDNGTIEIPSRTVASSLAPESTLLLPTTSERPSATRRAGIDPAEQLSMRIPGEPMHPATPATRPAGDPRSVRLLALGLGMALALAAVAWALT